MPKAIIQRPLLTVRQNCVGLRDFLEFIFRVRVIRIAIGMVRHRKLAIGALDLHFGGRTGDAEDLVIIAFCVCGQKLPLIFNYVASVVTAP